MTELTQRQYDAIALDTRKADDYTRIPQAVAMVLEPEVRPDYSMRAVVTIVGRG